MSASTKADSSGTTSTGPELPHRPAFVTTHWSVVLTAAGTDTTRAHEALSCLCEIYWYPLYAYVRRRGHSPDDAQDLTQEFFARLLEKHWLARADREKGRFRSFLLMAMKRFLANEWDKAQALKRGGHIRLVPPIRHGRNALLAGARRHLHAGAGVRKAVGADAAGNRAPATARRL